MSWFRDFTHGLFSSRPAASRSHRRTRFVAVEALEQRLVPAAANLTAYRPVSDYFGYANFPVPENQEDSHSLGPGIRFNGDDDNRNRVADYTESSQSFFNDNDLVRVDVAVTGSGQLNYSSDLKVWTGQRKQAPIADGATITTGTIWVEYVSMSHTSDAAPATLDLTVTDTNGTATDHLAWHSFQSVVIAIGGFLQNPIFGYGSQGVYNIARTLYQQGYDAQMFTHFQVGWGGTGAAYNEVVSAVKDRNVDYVAIIGFSWGGSATHDLAKGLQSNTSIQGQYSLSYTGYIDAITHYWVTSERRLPPGTAYHDNIYQRRDWFFKGNSVTGANSNINATNTSWGSSLIHVTIDDNATVQATIVANLIPRVVR